MKRAVTLVALLVASLAVGPTAAGAATESTRTPGAADVSTGVGAADTPTIQKSIRLHLTPSEPGVIGVTVTYDVPDVLTSLQVRLPEDARNVRTQAFSKRDGVYAWDGSTDPATLRFAMPANETTGGSRALERSERLQAPGSLLFADVGPWALVTVPTLGTQWGWRNAETVTLNESVTVDGPGSTGGEIAYLGPETTYTRTANGQTFTLVVPERASMIEPPRQVLDALAGASGRLRVGARDERVWIAAAPTSVLWGVQGVEYGGSDAWVLADSRLNDAGNVWFHEYVHTRQDYTAATSGKWTVEASAVYYAAFLSLRAGFIEFDAFQTYLEQGERQPWRDAILARPETWESAASYVKGSLVWGSIDRRIRLATDSGATMGDVLWAMNRHDGKVTNDDVLRAVADVSTERVAAYAERYTETRAVPEMWTRAEHAAAFSERPPHMVYDVQTYRVTGPYRTATFDSPPHLYVGETLTVEALVTNTGGAEGTYVATITLHDDPVAVERATLAPTETDALTLQHEFTEPGTYYLTIGRTPVPLTVEEPAAVAVSNLSVSETRVRPGSQVTVTVTLTNPHDEPAAGPVPVLLDGEQVASVTATLAAGGSATRTVTVTIPTAGEYTIAVGDEAVSVTATEPGEDGAGIPGFGVAVALAAVLVAAVVAARER